MHRPQFRWGAVVDVDPDAGKARMCWFDGSGPTTVKKDQLERGIEATWSTAEVERQVVKKGNVIVV